MDAEMTRRACTRGSRGLTRTARSLVHLPVWPIYAPRLHHNGITTREAHSANLVFCIVLQGSEDWSGLLILQQGRDNLLGAKNTTGMLERWPTFFKLCDTECKYGITAGLILLHAFALKKKFVFFFVIEVALFYVLQLKTE